MRRNLLLPMLFAVMAGGALAVSFWRFAPGDAPPIEPSQAVQAPEKARDPADAAAPGAARTGADAEEPTKEDCIAAVDKARALANALSADHPSRYIAERHLHQSMVEAGNGEFDDCLYWAERASDEVRELRHAAGEKIRVMQSDELPKQQPLHTKALDKKHAHGKGRH